jgi:hypothetical protein
MPSRTLSNESLQLLEPAEPRVPSVESWNTTGFIAGLWASPTLENLRDCADGDHCARSAMMGSMREARSDGSRHAAIAIRAKRAVTAE